MGGLSSTLKSEADRWHRAFTLARRVRLRSVWAATQSRDVTRMWAAEPRSTSQRTYSGECRGMGLCAVSHVCDVCDVTIHWLVGSETTQEDCRLDERECTVGGVALVFRV